MTNLFDCHITIKGQSKPLFRCVWAASAAEAKETIRNSAIEQGVVVTKITARKSF